MMLESCIVVIIIAFNIIIICNSSFTAFAAVLLKFRCEFCISWQLSIQMFHAPTQRAHLRLNFMQSLGVRPPLPPSLALPQVGS